MEETQIPKPFCTDKPWEKREKNSPLIEPGLRGMMSLVKRIPKEKTRQRGKRR